MRRHIVLRSVAVVSMLLAASAAQSAPTPAPTTIRFIGAPGDDLLGFWYAQSTGMFAKAGLNVIWEKASSGAAVPPAIVGGVAEIGRTSINSLIAAHARKVPFVLIAPGAVHEKRKSINSGILVLTNSPYKSMLDLQGKTVSSTELGSIGAIGLRAWIDANGGDSSTVRFIELPTGAMKAALEQGRIDAVVSNEPVMTRDLADGKVRVIGDMLDGYPGVMLESAYFGMRDWVVANQDAVTKFVRVLRQASAYANKHPTELLPMLIANTGLDPSVAANMKHARIGINFDASQVQQIVDLVAKYKIIPNAFDAREMFEGAPK
jgi:NitT/TauT family transport system substrate-binding protein